ncbi:MAG: Rieske 2Fe-2S domain-containing protein [Spirochaetia bacterium]|nr:Rieske 2Fe-2S domain-containing protein [Spirochaetia bacterium]
MSDVLDYLIKTRGEAMLPYFTFLKEAGKRLDPKTRDLISVITKVDVKTESGFKQYMTRALRNGCTPDEILDALLMAFPTLGLAKIVWAVDIILEMDIPEFRPENLGREETWHDILSMSEIKDNDVTYAESDGRSFFIYRENDLMKVYDSRCPHQVTDIPNLSLDQFKLTCPKHKWVFDIKTGKCIDKGKHPLKEFKHKIENDRLHVYF